MGAGNGVEVAQFVVGLIREPGLWHPRINGAATCHGSRESSGCPDCSGKPKQLRSKPACRTLLILSSDWRSRISQFTKTVNTKKARHHKEAGEAPRSWKTRDRSTSRAFSSRSPRTRNAPRCGSSQGTHRRSRQGHRGASLVC